MENGRPLRGNGNGKENGNEGKEKGQGMEKGGNDHVIHVYQRKSGRATLF